MRMKKRKLLDYEQYNQYKIYIRCIFSSFSLLLNYQANSNKNKNNIQSSARIAPMQQKCVYCWNTSRQSSEPYQHVLERPDILQQTCILAKWFHKKRSGQVTVMEGKRRKKRQS